MSEVALREEEICNCVLNNYELVSSYCRDDKNRGGGTCIYVKNGINCKTVDVKSYCVDKLIETCATRIKYNDQNILLLCIYRNPNVTPSLIDLFFEILSDIVDNVKLPTEQLIIIGDLNICVLTNDYRLTRLNEFLNLYNLKSTIDKPTRVTPTSQTAIDNILTDVPLFKITSEVHKTVISDHYGISINIQCDCSLWNKQINYRVCREFKKENYELFEYYLKNETWDTVTSFTTDLNISYNKFDEIIKAFYNLSFVQKIKKVVDRKKTRVKKFDDPRIVQQQDRVRFLHELYNSKPSANIRNQINIETKIYKSLLYNKNVEVTAEKMNSASNKTKAAWDIINNERYVKNKSLVPKEIVSRSNSYTNPQDICETFNNYFVESPFSVIEDLQKNVGTHTKTDKTICHSIYLKPVDENELITIINSLKNKNSNGPDKISNNILKKFGKFLAVPLMHLINLSLKTGCFPDKLKLTRIIPVYKKGDSKDVSNYRPIALTSCISKIFEKVMKNRLLLFLNKNKILSDKQLGFQAGKSTIDLVLQTVNNIVTNLDKRQTTIGMFLDLSKAFDCVNHVTLLKKLEMYGIRGVALQWFRSYLTNRHQYTEITSSTSNCKSSVKPVKIGVPQGSVLGPLLYIIYVNSILDSQTNSTKTYMFADDTSTLVSTNSLSNTICISNSTIDLLTQHFAQHSLAINVTKTNFIMFKPRGLDIPQPQIKVNGFSIEQVDCTKFLGIFIDDRLDWQFHVDHIAKKINSGMFVLRRISAFQNLALSLTIYYSLIFSHISYGIQIWGAGRKEHLDRVFVLQKKAVRYIFGLKKGDTCKSYFKESGILTVPSLYIMYTVLYVKQHIHQLAKLGDNHSHNTRNRNTLANVSHNTYMFSQQSIYRGIKLYNSLPNNLKSIENYKLFKTHLKSFLINQCYYSVPNF